MPDGGRGRAWGTWVVVALMGFLFVTGCGNASEKGIEQARQNMQEFQKQVELLTQAQGTGDAAGASAAEKAALAALRDARENFRAGGVDTSNDPKVVKEYVEVLTRLQDTDLLVKTLRRLVRLDPADMEARVRLGRALTKSTPGDAKEAAQVYREVIERNADPRMVAAACDGLADLYVNDGLYDLARQYLEKAVSTFPEAVSAKVALAALDVREGKMKAASDTLQSLGNTAIPPEAVARLSKALNAFSESRRAFPDTAENHMAYAQVLIRSDRLADSLLPLQRAVALVPQDFVGWNMLGSIRQAVGDLPGARSAFERSLQLKPDQPRTVQSIQDIDRAMSKPAGPLAPQPGGMQ